MYIGLDTGMDICVLYLFFNFKRYLGLIIKLLRKLGFVLPSDLNCGPESKPCILYNGDEGDILVIPSRHFLTSHIDPVPLPRENHPALCVDYLCIVYY